jgi:hypothetical protein
MNEMSPILAAYADGFFTCAALVAALFFLRFWRDSREVLFGSFAAAFLLMAVSNVLPVIWGSLNDERPAVYLPRLAAFGVIILAVLRKNL